MESLDTETCTERQCEDTGRIPCEDKGIDGGDISTNQGTPKIASKPLVARRHPSLTALRRRKLCNTLILNFYASEL